MRALMSEPVQACPPAPGGNGPPREPSRGGFICPAREAPRTSRTAKSASWRRLSSAVWAQQAGRIPHDRPEAREIGALICLARDEPALRVMIARPPAGRAALGLSGRTRLSRQARLTVRVGFVAVTAPPDGIDVPRWVCNDPQRGAVMSGIITVGLDLAKNVFQFHGADAAGRAVLRKKLRRDQVLAFFGQLPSCVVAMEACGSAITGAARSASRAMKCG